MPVSTYLACNANSTRQTAGSLSSPEVTPANGGMCTIRVQDQSLWSQAPKSLGTTPASLSNSSVVMLPPDIQAIINAASNEELLQMCMSKPNSTLAKTHKKIKKELEERSTDDTVEIYSVEMLQIIAKAVAGDPAATENTKKMADAFFYLVNSVVDGTKVAAQLGINGKIVVKTYANKTYVIIKGYAGMRAGSGLDKLVRGSLKGTRYLADNFKSLVTEVTTLQAVKSVAKKGSVITIGIVAAIDVLEYFLDDEMTLKELGINVAVDTAKALISGVVGTLAGIAITATIGVPVVMGVLAGLAIGYVVGRGLDYLDKKAGISDRLKEWAKESDNKADNLRRTVAIESDINQCFSPGETQRLLNSVLSGTDINLMYQVSYGLNQKMSLPYYYYTSNSREMR